MASLAFFAGLVLMVFAVGHVLEASYVSVTTSPPPTCATIDCLPNQTCKMYNGVPKCVKIPGSDCNIACTLEFEPVCGSDGKTYSNACKLKVAACKAGKIITIASFGACPVGCEAVTCLLPKVCKEINGKGTCVCRTACPKILHPVCGSDGVTYKNECLLKVEACKTNQEITVVSQGSCPIGCEAVSCVLPKVCREINGQGTCVCRTACPKILRPVCGSDGVTYNNECLLKVEACKTNKEITVVSQGRCPTGCALIRCASPRICEEVNGVGRCVCPTICPAVFQPVCGSDGKTYSNECSLRVAACNSNKTITVVSQGPCPQTTLAPTQAPNCDPVICASPNVCRLVNGQSKCICSKFCTLEFAPVCGSDGKTYSNTCSLRVAACTTNTRITIVSQGACPQTTPTPTQAPNCDPVICASPNVCRLVNGQSKCICSKICTLEFAPVCGSDGRTYSNTCSLRVAACTTNTRITIVSQGACPQTTPTPTQAPNCDPVICANPNVCRLVNGQSKCICSKFCTLELMPVCGSDGKTYPNKCGLRVAACEANKRITVASLGSCAPTIKCANVLCTANTRCKMINGKPVCLSCPDACPEIYKPVCGSDQVTYDNECEMKRAGCKKGIIIKVVHNRPCGKVCFNFKCHSPPYSKCENVNGSPKCVCKFFCYKRQHLVCGSDGKTYDNICIMKKTACETKKNITVARKELCNNPCLQSRPCRSPPYSSCRLVDGKAKCVCNKACPLVYAPVCGSDGKTYRNKCQLKASSCRKNKKVRVRSIGKCINPCMSRICTNYATCEVKNGKAVCVCPRACTKVYRPVCGTDGHTYSNKCRMRVASCERGKKKIKVAYEGRCRETPDSGY